MRTHKILLAGLIPAALTASVLGAQGATKTTQKTPNQAPSEEQIFGILKVGSEKLQQATCGVVPDTRLQLDAMRVTRRGQFNTGGAGAGAVGVSVGGAAGYWPVEVHTEGTCKAGRMVSGMFGISDEPVAALVQLRLSRNDFGDLVGTVVDAQKQPAHAGWMKATLATLARAEQDFVTNHSRYTSSLERLKLEIKGGMVQPIILAERNRWWAYVTHAELPDSICVMAGGESANEVTQASALMNPSTPTCTSLAQFAAATGQTLPTASREPKWPVGSAESLSAATSAAPMDWFPGAVTTWSEARARFPTAAIRVPASPAKVWSYLHESARASKGRTPIADREQYVFAMQRDAAMGVLRYRYYFGLTADSIDATSTDVRFQVYFYGAGDPKYKDAQKLSEKGIADFEKDFPGTVRLPR